MKVINLIKIIIIAIVEGITEWLPISSTGHMLLVEEYLKIKKIFIGGESFYELFLVVIQLGAVCAVIFKYFKTLNPFNKKNNNRVLKNWLFIIASTIPAAITGLIFDEMLFSKLYKSIVVGSMLIIYGIIFLFIEKREYKNKEMTIKRAFLIGLFQILALIPGTSRSGILIIAGIIILGNKVSATKYSFLCSIPIMFGASMLKIIKYGKINTFYSSDLLLLVIGMIISFIVSLIVIEKLLSFVRNHHLKGFGIYRIVLGTIVILALLF